MVPTRAESAKRIARYRRKAKPLLSRGDEGLVRGLHLRFVENLRQREISDVVGLSAAAGVESGFQWWLSLASVRRGSPGLVRGRSCPCDVSMSGSKSFVGCVPSGVRGSVEAETSKYFPGVQRERGFESNRVSRLRRAGGGERAELSDHGLFVEGKRAFGAAKPQVLVG